MDKEYREHIAGSPYLEEGIGQQLKAKAAGAISAGQAMLGQRLDRPEHAKIKSHWETFTSQLLYLLKDIKENVDPLIRHRQAQIVDPEYGHVSSSLTEEQEDLLTAFEDLYYSITPTSIKRHQLSKILREAFWDIAKRDIFLNRALASRNPIIILNAYKRKIVNLLNKFLEDASKSTRIPKEYIPRITKGIYPPTKLRDILNKIDAIKNIPDLVPKPVQGKVPPIISKTPAPSSTGTALPGSPPKETGSLTGITAPTDISQQATNYASIVLKTIRIIIDAVRSDIAHAAPFIGPEQVPLPKGWGEPAPTKVTAPQSTIKEEPVEPTKPIVDPDVESEIENQFLYNFASKWNKWSNYNIEVKPVNEPKTFTLPSGEEKEITVIWKNSSHTNDIYAKLKGKSGITLDLMFRFYDDQANPKTETGKEFNINTLLQQAKPMSPDILQKADSKIVGEIKKLSDGIESPLGRSLYATIYRKAMEFKPKKKHLKQLTIQAGGAVTDTTSGKPETYTQEELGALLNSDPETSSEWDQNLEAIGYFQLYPNMKPKSMEQYQSFQDAVKALKTLGHKETEAMQLVKDAWFHLRTVEQKAPNSISVEDIIKTAKKSPEKSNVKAVSPSPGTIVVGNLQITKDGGVVDYSVDPPRIYDQNELLDLLDSDPETSEKWEKKLTNIGYFKLFPRPMNEYKSFQAAVSILQTLGFNNEEAITVANYAWVNLRTVYKKDPDSITSDDIINNAKENVDFPIKPGEPTKTQSSPEFSKKSDPTVKTTRKEGEPYDEKIDGKAWVDEEDPERIKWLNPASGETVSWGKSKVIAMMIKSKRFLKALKAAGLHKNLLPVARKLKQQTEKPSLEKSEDGSTPEKPTTEIINPFQRINFLP